MNDKNEKSDVARIGACITLKKSEKETLIKIFTELKMQGLSISPQLILRQACYDILENKENAYKYLRINIPK